MDEDDTPLIYEAKLINGNPLPNWLKFNSDSRIFYGTPSKFDIGNLTVNVEASDNFKKVADNFTLMIYNNKVFI